MARTSGERTRRPLSVAQWNSVRKGKYVGSRLVGRYNEREHMVPIVHDGRCYSEDLMTELEGPVFARGAMCDNVKCEMLGGR